MADVPGKSAFVLDRELAGDLKVAIWNAIKPVLRDTETGFEVASVLTALGEVVGLLVAGWETADQRERALDQFHHGIRTAVDTIDAEQKRGIH